MKRVIRLVDPLDLVGDLNCPRCLEPMEPERDAWHCRRCDVTVAVDNIDL